MGSTTGLGRSAPGSVWERGTWLPLTSSSPLSWVRRLPCQRWPEMDGLIITLWWLILILALVLTVILLAVVVRVVFALREIDRLARMTLPAAVGIVENTAMIAALDDVLAQAGRLLHGV